jgi:lipopolysaccharide/colanic/teichoic acid biosynthesis glycosyltransferase
MAVVLLVLASPVLAAVAFTMRSISSGPILVSEEWLTTGAVAASAYAFRTSGEGTPLSRGLWRFLRHTSLDRLPSLWNVAHGQVRFHDLLSRGRRS